MTKRINSILKWYKDFEESGTDFTEEIKKLKDIVKKWLTQDGLIGQFVENDRDEPNQSFI